MTLKLSGVLCVSMVIIISENLIDFACSFHEGMSTTVTV